MARRTKAEAERTRDSLLDAAEALFDERGVPRTHGHCDGGRIDARRGVLAF